MNVSICAECEVVLAVGAFNPGIPATHLGRVDGKVHTGTVVKLQDDPMGQGETPTDYFKRLKKTYKKQLFK